jgi:hypothetical protein
MTDATKIVAHMLAKASHAYGQSRGMPAPSDPNGGFDQPNQSIEALSPDDLLDRRNSAEAAPLVCEPHEGDGEEGDWPKYAFHLRISGGRMSGTSSGYRLDVGSLMLLQLKDVLIRPTVSLQQWRSSGRETSGYVFENNRRSSLRAAAIE